MAFLLIRRYRQVPEATAFRLIPPAKLPTPVRVATPVPSPPSPSATLSSALRRLRPPVLYMEQSAHRLYQPSVSWRSGLRPATLLTEHTWERSEHRRSPPLRLSPDHSLR